MVSLYIKDGELRIDDSSKEIFTWQHRTFFNISLEFELDPENARYFSEDKNEFQNAIKEITGYLTDEGIEFTTDDQVGKLIENIRNQDRLETLEVAIKDVLHDKGNHETDVCHERFTKAPSKNLRKECIFTLH